MSWTYDFLIEEFENEIKGYMNDDKLSLSEALGITFNEFYNEKSEDEMAKALINILDGEYSILLPRIFVKVKEFLISSIESIDFNKIEKQILNGKLNHEQLNDLKNRAKLVLDSINKVPVENCALARWYYYDITKEIKDFFSTQYANSNSSEIIFDNMKKIYWMPFQNLVSVEMTANVTLTEMLVENGQPVPVLLKDAINSFNILDTEDQLTKEEKEDLLKRMQALSEYL